MEATDRYLSVVTVVIVLVLTVSVNGDSNKAALTDSVIPEAQYTVNAPFIRTLVELTAPELVGDSASILDEIHEARVKRLSPTSASARGLDSKVSKLKIASRTPQEESDTVPVIRGLAGLSPAELRALTNEDEDVDDGKLLRTTEKSVRKAKTKDEDDDVPIITGTKDRNNPSRQDARAGKTAGEDDDVVVQLNAHNPRPQQPPILPVPSPSPPPVSIGRVPSFRTPSAVERCRHRKLMQQLDAQLLAMRRINDQRQEDIARSLSWVNGAGSGGPGVPGSGPNGFAPSLNQVPIPYFPYLSNLPIYGRSDWSPLQVQIPLNYQYQVDGNNANNGRNNGISGVYQRTWLPNDPLNCDLIEEEEKNLRASGSPAFGHYGTSSPPPPNYFTSSPPSRTYFSSTPPPPSYLNSSPPPPSYLNSSPPPPSYLNSSPPPPSYYNSSPPPPTYLNSSPRPLNSRIPRPYGRAYRPISAPIEVDGKIAKPNEDANEDEEEE